MMVIYAFMLCMYSHVMYGIWHSFDVSIWKVTNFLSNLKHVVTLIWLIIYSYMLCYDNDAAIHTRASRVFNLGTSHVVTFRLLYNVLTVYCRTTSEIKTRNRKYLTSVILHIGHGFQNNMPPASEAIVRCCIGCL